MNKKAIFIPFLLLVIQPNRILSSAGNYDRAKEKIETILKGQGLRYNLNYFNNHKQIFVPKVKDSKVQEVTQQLS